jgi:hypothetical protein
MRAGRGCRNAESALAYLRHAVLNRSRSVLRHQARGGQAPAEPAAGQPSAEYVRALVRLERSRGGRGAAQAAR